jgi:hypothetical protein
MIDPLCKELFGLLLEALHTMALTSVTWCSRSLTSPSTQRYCEGLPRCSYGHQEKATWMPVRGIITLHSSSCPHVAHTTVRAVDGVGPFPAQPWSGWRRQGLTGALVPTAVQGVLCRRDPSADASLGCCSWYMRDNLRFFAQNNSQKNVIWTSFIVW